MLVRLRADPGSCTAEFWGSHQTERGILPNPTELVIGLSTAGNFMRCHLGDDRDPRTQPFVSATFILSAVCLHIQKHKVGERQGRPLELTLTHSPEHPGGWWLEPTLWEGLSPHSTCCDLCLCDSGLRLFSPLFPSWIRLT